MQNSKTFSPYNLVRDFLENLRKESHIFRNEIELVSIVGVIGLLKESGAKPSSDYSKLFQLIDTHLCRGELVTNPKYFFNSNTEVLYPKIISILDDYNFSTYYEFKEFYKELYRHLIMTGRSGMASSAIPCPQNLLHLIDSIWSNSNSQVTIINSGLMPDIDDLKSFSTPVIFQSINPQINFLIELLSLIFDLNVNFDSKEPQRAKDLISFPPFGLRVNEDQTRLFFDTITPRDALQLEMLEFLEDYQEGSRAVFLVPNGFLTSSSRSYRLIRQYLIKNNLVHTVINLPAGIFSNSGIATSLVFIEKNNSNHVAFIDSRDHYVNLSSRKKIIDLDAIVRALTELSDGESSKDHTAINTPQEVIYENEFSLFGAEYSLQFDDPIPLNHESISLSSIIQRIRPQIPIMGQSYLKVSAKDFEGGSRLEHQDFNHCENFDPASNIDRLRNFQTVCEPCLLVSSILNKELKLAYYHPTDNQQIVVTRDILILKVNTVRVKPEYLMLRLGDQRILNQLGSSIVGAALPRFNLRSFLRLHITIPSLAVSQSIIEEIQENAIREAKQLRFQSIIREQGLQDEIKALKQQFINDTNSQLHTLGNSLLKMRNTVKRLIADLNSDETSRIEKAKERSQKLYQSVLSNETMIENLGKLVTDKEPVEVIDIVEFLEHWAARQDYSNIFINIDDIVSRYLALADKEQDSMVNIEICVSDLEHKIIENIFSNAVRHGFKDDGKKYEFRITVVNTEIDGRAYCHLIFENDGAPLPKGVDTEFYCAKSLSAGKTANTGMGGADVCSAVRDAGGFIKVETNGTDQFPFSIDIFLPLAD